MQPLQTLAGTSAWAVPTIGRLVACEYFLTQYYQIVNRPKKPVPSQRQLKKLRRQAIDEGPGPSPKHL